MPVVKFQPPHSRSCGRITVASLEYKQAGRATAAGLATRTGGWRSCCSPVLLCFPISGPEGPSVAVRFVLGAAGHCPLMSLAWDVCSQHQQCREEM